MIIDKWITYIWDVVIPANIVFAVIVIILLIILLVVMLIFFPEGLGNLAEWLDRYFVNKKKFKEKLERAAGNKAVNKLLEEATKK